MFHFVRNILFINLFITFHTGVCAKSIELLSLEDEIYFPYSNCLMTTVDFNSNEKFSIKLSENPYISSLYSNYLSGCNENHNRSTYIILSNYNRFDYDFSNQKNVDTFNGKNINITVVDQLNFNDGISMQMLINTKKGLVLYLDLLYNSKSFSMRQEFVCNKINEFSKLNDDSTLQSSFKDSGFCQKYIKDRK